MASIFFDIPGSSWLAFNERALAIREGCPVSPGHTLVIPRWPMESRAQSPGLSGGITRWTAVGLAAPAPLLLFAFLSAVYDPQLPLLGLELMVGWLGLPGYLFVAWHGDLADGSRTVRLWGCASVLSVAASCLVSAIFACWLVFPAILGLTGVAVCYGLWPRVKRRKVVRPDAP